MEAGKLVSVALGGMDDRPFPAPGTARNIADMVRDADGAWRSMPGALEVTGIVTGLQTMSLHWFNPRGAQRWLLIEREVDASTSRISYVDFQAGAAENILTTRRRLASSALPTQFLDVNGWCLMLSPIDGLVRWNGERLLPVGFQLPGPVLTGAGPDQGFEFVDHAAGVFGGTFAHPTQQRGVGEFPDPSPTQYLYGYALSQTNDLGQDSPVGPIIWVTGDNNTPADDGYSMLRLFVPRLGDNILACTLWRTVNLYGVAEPGLQGVALYELERFLNAGGFDWLDLKSDGELGIQYDPDRVGLVPTGARAMAFWRGRLWLGGMPDNPSRAHYSHGLFPEQFPEHFYLDIGGSHTGGIAAYRAVPQGLLAFKAGGVYLIRGNGTDLDPFRTDDVTETVGTSAPLAIEVIPGGAVFLSDQGPMLIQPTAERDSPLRVVPAVAAVSGFWEKKVGPDLASAVACYNPALQEVWFSLPGGGDPRPTVGLVLHTSTGGWSTRMDWLVSCMEFYAGRLWCGSWDEFGVFVVTYASRQTPGGEDITSTYSSNGVLFESHQKILQVDVWGLGIGTNPELEVSTRTDHERMFRDQTETEGKKQQHARHDRPVWGTATWDAGDIWTDYEPAVFPVSLLTEVGYRHQVRFMGSRMRLFELVVHPSKGAVPHPRERS